MGLAALGEEDCEGVLVAVEEEILPDELVDDEVLVGEVGPAGRGVVEGREDLGADAGADLGQDSPLFEGVLEDLLEFVDAGHDLNTVQPPYSNHTLSIKIIDVVVVPPAFPPQRSRARPGPGQSEPSNWLRDAPSTFHLPDPSHPPLPPHPPPSPLLPPFQVPLPPAHLITDLRVGGGVGRLDRRPQSKDSGVVPNGGTDAEGAPGDKGEGEVS